MGRSLCQPLPLLLLLMGMCLLGSCGRSSEPVSGEYQEYQHFIRRHGDSLALRPSWMRGEMYRLMAATRDSLLYYSCQAMVQKTWMISSEFDSVWPFNRALERYLATCRPAPRVADLASDCYNIRGNLYARTGCLDSAEHYFRLALARLKEGTNVQAQPDILMNLADVCCQRGRMELGASCYRQAWQLCDSLGLPDRRKTPIYYGLGQIYVHLRDFGQCDRYYSMADSLYDQLLLNEKYIYLNNRGTSYYYREEYATAIGYFQRALRLLFGHPECGFEKHLSHLNLGDCYLKIGQADSARLHMQACEPYFRKWQISAALYYLHTQQLQLALLQHDLPRARQLAASDSSAHNIPPDLVHIRNLCLQDYYEAVGDYRQALRYHRLNDYIEDSIRSERIRMRTADQALRYAQDSTLLAQKALVRYHVGKVESLRTIIFCGIGLTLLLLLLVLYIWLYNRKRRDLLLAQNRREVSSLRLENVRNRLSPHFIFNVINREVADHTPEERSRLMDLGRLIRSNLALADKVCVSLTEELEFVQTYMDIERPTLGSDFEMQVTLAPDVVADQVLLPSMFIQIPVENAVKHALRLKEGHRLLHIEVRCQGTGYAVTILDNGGGYRPSPQAGTGTGLKIVMQTIQLLNQHNREKMEVRITDEELPGGEKGCRVEYFLPRHYKFLYEDRRNNP